MGLKSPEVDTYISHSPGFARPILQRLRSTVHSGCPGVEETITWGFPHFMYQGILCSMAAFKHHCAFSFWKGSLIVGTNVLQTKQSMGQFGKITSVDDLPDKKTLLAYVREAVRLNESGVKSPTRSKPRRRKPLRAPAPFKAALRSHVKAAETFRGFSAGHKREYLEWIIDAKTDETRTRRIATAVKWLAEGKTRNWKYIRK